MTQRDIQFSDRNVSPAFDLGRCSLTLHINASVFGVSYLKIMLAWEWFPWKHISDGISICYVPYLLLRLCLGKSLKSAVYWEHAY